MSLAAILKSFGLPPADIAWLTLQNDVIEKANGRHDLYQTWANTLHGIEQSQAMDLDDAPDDAVEYFKQKYANLGLPADLKHLLGEKFPQQRDEIEALRTIGGSGIHQLWRGSAPDEVTYWGDDGDPRVERRAPEPEPEPEPELETEEIPFGPAGMPRVDEKYADAPAIAEDEQEAEVAAPLQTRREEELAAQQTQTEREVEARAVPGAEYDETGQRVQPRAPLPADDGLSDEEDEEMDRDHENYQRLARISPHQGMVTWILNNFGYAWLRHAREEGLLVGGQQKQQLSELSEEEMQDSMDAAMSGLQHQLGQEYWPGPIRETWDGKQKQSGKVVFRDAEGNTQRGRRNPFYGGENTEAGTVQAFANAMNAVRMSPKSLIEASMTGNQWKTRQLANTVHRSLMAKEHFMNLDDKKLKTETDAMLAGPTALPRGHVCPDCEMGHSPLFYHHNYESQLAAGQKAGAPHERFGGRGDPAVRIGRGSTMPDLYAFDNVLDVTQAYEQQMKVHDPDFELPESMTTPKGVRNNQGQYRRIIRDLEHMYRSNTLHPGVRGHLDRGGSRRVDAEGDTRGTHQRRIDSARIGEIREPTEEQIRAIHGGGLWNRDKGVGANTAGFILPGEFHPPNMFGGYGDIDWQEGGGIFNGFNTTPEAEDAANKWVWNIAQLKQKKQSGIPVVPPVPQQTPSRFGAGVEPTGGTFTDPNTGAAYPQFSFPFFEQSTAQLGGSHPPVPPAEVAPVPTEVTMPPMQSDVLPNLPREDEGALDAEAQQLFGMGNRGGPTPLNEEQIRAFEHLGRHDRITPINHTGGPTKCTMCAGHGDVPIHDARNYARMTNEDAAGLTDAELDQWMAENYRPAGKQGSFGEITQDTLQSFTDATGLQYDPDNEQHVNAIQSMVDVSGYTKFACPHCDAPHPLMEDGHKAATGVCPTCVGHGRVHHSDHDYDVPTPPHALPPMPQVAGIDTQRLTGEKERPSWLKAGLVGQQRGVRTENLLRELMAQDAQRQRERDFQQKIEPFHERFLDGTLGLGGDIANVEGSAYAQRLEENEEMVRGHNKRYYDDISRLGQAWREHGMSFPDPATLSTDYAEERKKKPVESPLGFMAGDLGPKTIARLTETLQANEPKELARRARMLQAALDQSTMGQRLFGQADVDPVETFHGDGLLEQVGPMHMTNLEYFLKFGRAPRGGVLYGDGKSGGKSYQGDPVSETQVVSAADKDKGSERQRVVGMGGNKPVGNEIRDMLDERNKHMHTNHDAEVAQEVAYAHSMRQELEDYLNNPDASAEDNPVQATRITLPNGMQENLLSYDSHARRKTGTGQMLKELSPFHKKMNELRGSYRNEFMNHWKQAATKAMQGSASPQDIASSINRRWTHWKRKSSNQKLMNDYTDKMMSKIKVDEKGLDVHNMTPAKEKAMGLTKEQMLSGLNGLKDRVSNVDDWAEYKIDQKGSQKHRWMVEKEPNTLWQMALHAFHDGELDESQLQDTVREIVDEHPGWSHYSLRDLNEWKESMKQPKPQHSRPEGIVRETNEMQAWRELWGDMWPQVARNLMQVKGTHGSNIFDIPRKRRQGPTDPNPNPRGPKPERPSRYNFLDYPEYAPWLPPEDVEDEDDPVEKAMVSLRISRFIAQTSLGRSGP